MEVVFVILFMLIVIAAIITIDYLRAIRLRNCPQCGHRMSFHHKLKDNENYDELFIFYCPHCRKFHKVYLEDLLNTYSNEISNT